MQPEAVNPRRMAFAAKITVTRYLGFLYTASRYTFSPPERGIIVPNSSQMKRPQNDRMKPSTQSMRDAPTDPTDPRIEEGVEKMPVPMMRPTLYGEAWVLALKFATIRGNSHEECATEHAQMPAHATGRIWRGSMSIRKRCESRQQTHLPPA